MNKTTGALVVGGNLNGLSIARSLGRHGVPVWVVSPPNIRLASFSRYTRRTLPWPAGDDETQVRLDELLHRRLVALADPVAEAALLLDRDARQLGDLLQVLLE